LKRRRRRRTNWVFAGVIASLVLIAVLYVLGGAAIKTPSTAFQFHELLLARGIDCVVVIWLFCVGSAIGSFLNVVAWRMPRGKSINGFSHCPRCQERLAWHDNLPVFGWLALRGRCRSCHLPISPRYPLVELVVGLCITAIGLVELYGGLRNLPIAGGTIPRLRPLSMPIVTREMGGFWLYHTAAVTSLWGLGLIRFDAQRLPLRLVLFVFAVVIGGMLLWWPLAVVPWQLTDSAVRTPWSLLGVVMRMLTGLVAGTMIARSLGRFVAPAADLKLDPLGKETARLVDLIAIMSIVGIVVGWQASLGVAVVATLLAGWLAQRVSSRPLADRDGLAWLAVTIPVVVTLQIVFWRTLEAVPIWPSSHASPWTIVAAAMLLLILPMTLRTIPAESSAPREEDPEDDPVDEDQEVDGEDRAAASA